MYTNNTQSAHSNNTVALSRALSTQGNSVESANLNTTSAFIEELAQGTVDNTKQHTEESALILQAIERIEIIDDEIKNLNNQGNEAEIEKLENERSLLLKGIKQGLTTRIDFNKRALETLSKTKLASFVKGVESA